MIEMLVQPTFDIMSTRHNVSGARLITPLEVGTIVMPHSHMTLAKTQSIS